MFLLVLVLLLPTAAAAQSKTDAAVTNQTSPTARTLLRLEDEWARGVVRRDTAAFRKRLAPQFVYTEDAQVMGKADVIKGLVGSDTVVSANNHDMKVHDYGNTAVVTGILQMKGKGKDGPFDRRYRFTDTWFRRNGEWQIIAAQDYLMPK